MVFSTSVRGFKVLALGLPAPVFFSVMPMVVVVSAGLRGARVAGCVAGECHGRDFDAWQGGSGTLLGGWLRMGKICKKHRDGI